MNEKEMIEYLKKCANKAWAEGFDYAEVDNEILRTFLAKFPEGSVVLSKEEYEHFQKLITDEERCVLTIQQQAHKEILKEFAYCNDHNFYEKWLELCEKYDVEI